MAMRGERFELNLDPEDAYLGTENPVDADADAEPDVRDQSASKTPFGFDLIKDVLERQPSASKPPEPPKVKQTASGFPAHKKRDGPSRFKQRRAGLDSNDATTPKSARPERIPSQNKYLGSIADVSVDEKKSIDQQTTQMIENMSPEELAEARRELLSESSIGLIQQLLRRSTIEDQDDTQFAQSSNSAQHSGGNNDASRTSRPSEIPKKTVSFSEPARTPKPIQARGPTFDEDAPPPILPSDLQPVSSHFPLSDLRSGLATKQGSASELPSNSSNPPPALDPSSASFLSDLHSTYFPDLPSDPNQLAWMAPLPDETAAATDSRDPASQSPPADLRFDFRGQIVSKARSAAIPVTKGLHHHGKDPGSAGYTINELSIYARSTVPAQRCFAYQLLGRILYRLGKDKYGGQDSDRVQGLYEEIKRGYILEQLLKEAARDPGTGNESARVWALEAAWLWRKGGGKGLDNVEVDEDNVMGEAAGQILQEGLNPA